MMAVAFDLDRLEMVGEPVPIGENVAGAFRIGGGNLAYVPFGSDFRLMQVDRAGNAHSITEEQHPFIRSGLVSGWSVPLVLGD